MVRVMTTRQVVRTVSCVKGGSVMTPPGAADDWGGGGGGDSAARTAGAGGGGEGSRAKDVRIVFFWVLLGTLK